MARVATLLLVSLAPLGAQASPDPLAAAVAAYTDLEYDAAASRLRASLALTGQQRLGDRDRTRALMYLGATEIFRGSRPAAADAFRQLLLIDPRYRPDAVTFPPEVIAPFQETRIGVRAVSAVLPANSELEFPTARLPIRIFSSSLHDIRVRVTATLGAPERVVYEGVIGDSLVVSWDGRDASGRAADGRVLLRIASRGPDGTLERELQVPLEIERIPIDTLPWPEPLPPSALRPETEVRASGIRPLITGVFGALAVAVLPSVVGADEGSSTRYAVAGVLGVGGIIGFATATRPRPIPENIAFNRARRAEWEREAQRVQAENAERLATVRLRIRAERGTMVEIR
jgi:hypothetical protein